MLIMTKLRLLCSAFHRFTLHPPPCQGNVLRARVSMSFIKIDMSYGSPLRLSSTNIDKVSNIADNLASNILPMLRLCRQSETYAPHNQSRLEPNKVIDYTPH